VEQAREQKNRKVTGKVKKQIDYSRKMLHLRQTGWRPMGRIHKANQDRRERKRYLRQFRLETVLLQANAAL